MKSKILKELKTAQANASNLFVALQCAMEDASNVEGLLVGELLKEVKEIENKISILKDFIEADQ